MPPPRTDLTDALDSNDPAAIAQHASLDELERLKAAETLLELRRQRKQRTRFQATSQALVGYVALLGLGVNAFQSYSNQKQQQRQAAVDQQRWSREFDRAQQADKYRAFFETSILATDATNRDKRLVGYALLEEFVSDPNYHTKATLMLQESLLQELKRKHSSDGYDAEHNAMVEAILTALSKSSACSDLEDAATTIDRIAQHRTETGHSEEASRFFGMYVRKVIGKAVQVCETMRDFRHVKAPLVSSLVKVPELGGYPSPISSAEANTRIAQVLSTDCNQEILVSGATDCPTVLERYGVLCQADQSFSEETKACEVIADAVAGLH